MIVSIKISIVQEKRYLKCQILVLAGISIDLTMPGSLSIVMPEGTALRLNT
jgi:hypothetical protein